jgi:hypothetical protein
MEKDISHGFCPVSVCIVPSFDVEMVGVGRGKKFELNNIRPLPSTRNIRVARPGHQRTDDEYTPSRAR